MSNIPAGGSLKYVISPHPKAPIFNHENPGLVMDQMIQEMKNPQEAAREVIRQTGLVNLWFFLRFICSYSGPFDKLNNGLHLEMSNWFQQNAMAPGSRCAGFLGRKHYKSTVWTIGGNCIWLPLRDPNIRVMLFSSITERSMEFMHTGQRVFDSNDLFAWLYPECVPNRGQSRWNDKEMVLPNRTKHSTEPTVKPCGVCCSTAGLHGNRMVIDDPVSDVHLNSERESSSEMYKIGNWVKSNIRTLPDSPKDPIFYTATRYAIDDAHAFIFESVKKKTGFWDELDDVNEEPGGEWNIYFRQTEENGVIIFPENVSRTDVDYMKKNDPWTWYTQMQNSPYHSGLNELAQYEPKRCQMSFIETEPVFTYILNGDEKVIRLSDCDTVLACDPAASEKRMSAKTSRTATGFISHAPNDERFVWGVRAGFVPTSTVMDWIFTDKKRFNEYVRAFYLETQGAFKLLGNDFLAEQNRRNRSAKDPIYLNLRKVNKTGEKEAMIRATIQPLLDRGLLYIEEQSYGKVMNELRIFPMNRNKMDILDMMTLGLKNTNKPFSEEEELEMEEQSDWWSERTVGVCGY